jgi:hypothetical protein
MLDNLVTSPLCACPVTAPVTVLIIVSESESGQRPAGGPGTGPASESRPPLRDGRRGQPNQSESVTEGSGPESQSATLA